MAFDPLERSVESSRPVEVYQIDLGGQQFLYTSAEDTVTVSSLPYLPIPIKRSVLRQGPEERDTILEITVPFDNEFASKYLAIVPGQRAKITIRRVQRADLPTSDSIVIFTGFVQSVAYKEGARVAVIATLPVTSAKSRPIPRFKFQGLCNHVLYDDLCRVDSTDPAFRLSSGLVTDVTDDTITVTGAAAFGDGFFTSGEVTSPGELDARMILGHVGDVLTLLLPFGSDEVSVGTLVTVFAGCDHSIAVCKSKFDIVINYGGFSFVPNKNIFKTGLD